MDSWIFFQHKRRANKKHTQVSDFSLLGSLIPVSWLSVWLVACDQCSSCSASPCPLKRRPAHGSHFLAQAAGSKIAAFTGVNDLKSMFSCLYLGCFTMTFFSSLHNLSLFYFIFFTGDLRGISSLSLSRCAPVPCRRGEVVSAVCARERQIITLWETGGAAIVLSVCMCVFVCKQTHPQ